MYGKPTAGLSTEKPAASKSTLLRRLWTPMGLSPAQVLTIFAPATVILGAVALASKFLQIDIRQFIYDPATLANWHPLTSFLSNLGILIWCAAACVCLFTALLLRTRGVNEIFWFVLSAGLLSAFLTFDDLFMIHDFDGLAFRFLGVSEIMSCSILALIVAVFLIRFRTMILQSDFGLLLLALGFGAVSVYIDLFIPHLEDWDSWRNFAEDGFKWFAIVSWSSYYLRFCYLALIDLVRLK